MNGEDIVLYGALQCCVIVIVLYFFCKFIHQLCFALHVVCLLTLMYREGPSNKVYCTLALVVSGVVCCIFRFSMCSSLSQQISNRDTLAKTIEATSATLKKYCC